MCAITKTENILAYEAIVKTALEEIPELADITEYVVADFAGSIKRIVKELLPNARRVMCGMHFDK